MALLTGLGLWGATKAANDVGGTPPQVSGDSFDGRSLRRSYRDDVAPNLLLSTLMLASMAAASLCRGPIEASPHRRIPIADPQAQNWVLSTAPQSQAQAPLAGRDLFDSARLRRARVDDVVLANALLYSPPNIGLTTPDDFAGKPRRRVGGDDLASNLLTSTLSAAAPVVLPFRVADLGANIRRVPRAIEIDSSRTLLLSATPASNIDQSAVRFRRPMSESEEPSGSLLLTELSLPGAANVPFLAQELPSLKPRIGKTTDEAPNLLVGTFAIASQAVLPFPSGEWPVPKIRQFAQADGWPNTTLTTLSLPPLVVLPFASGEWPSPRIKRFGTTAESPNLAISTLALNQPAPAPFAPVDLSQSVRRRGFTDEPTANLLASVLSALPFTAAEFGSRRRMGRDDSTISNPLTSVLNAPLTTSIESVELASLRKLIRVSADQQSNLLTTTLRVPPVVLPFPSGEWLAPKIKRFAQADGPPNLILGTFSAAIVTVIYRGEILEAILEDDRRITVTDDDRRIEIRFDDRRILV